MGYDMYVVDSEGNTMNGDAFYFRRNAGSMGATRNALEEVGMGYWSAGFEQAAFPKGPSSDEPGHWDDDWEPVSDEAKAYRVAVENHLKATYDERPGIPLHKFTSNDGWWVTKVECEWALKLWEKAGRPWQQYFSDDLIPFLRVGAAYNGFQVY